MPAVPSRGSTRARVLRTPVSLARGLVVTDGGQYPRIADDREGNKRWLTEKEAALAEIERLRVEITRLKGG